MIALQTAKGMIKALALDSLISLVASCCDAAKEVAAH